MIMKALDLLRTLGWGIVDFLYSLIDSLFDILKEINALDIVSSLSNESMFRSLYTGIMAIAIAVLGLFSIWNFVKKIIDPDIETTVQHIVKDIVICGILILMSTFLFSQSAKFSIALSGYTATVGSTNEVSIADNMLTQYVSYSHAYKDSEDFKGEDYSALIASDLFTNKKLYKDKFVTDAHWILPDEKEYKYDINWIMAIVVGGFFLYALFFSGMMLARRQIEFLFLFVISPIIFATSVGNKEKRGVLYQQLISLILQGALIMLIIGLSSLIMKSVQGTMFFANSPVKDMVTKSILYIGCGVFLLTGSQAANRFIGDNVAANNGREQLMSMRGFTHGLKTGAVAAGLGALSAGAIGVGAATSTAGKLGGNKVTNNIGKGITNFGKKISGSSPIGSSRNNIGNAISRFGSKIQTTSPSSIGKNIRSHGYKGMADAIGTMDPTKNVYRRRYNRRI